MADETKTPDDYVTKTIKGTPVSLITRESSYTLTRHEIPHWILADNLLKLKVCHPTQPQLQYFVKLEKKPYRAQLLIRDRTTGKFTERPTYFKMTCFHELAMETSHWITGLKTIQTIPAMHSTSS